MIGNDLHRRKFEVVFVSKKLLSPLPPRVDETHQPTTNPSDSFVEYWLRIDIPDATSPEVHVKEIEEDIVLELVARHTEWIKNTQC